MSKLLLIDGNNLAHRVHWTHKELSFNGSPVSVIYGVCRSLVSLKKKFPEHFFVLVWDGGHERRTIESEKGVKDGIIPETYKENRRKAREIDAEKAETMELIHSQIDVLKEELKLMRIFQVCIDGVEADDVIFTYVMNNLKKGGESYVISSDKDYFQMLEDNIKLYDPLSDKTLTKEWFEAEFEFHPSFWVDVGAIMGDTGDNIFALPGWGQKTACKYVRQFGGLEEVIKGVQDKEKRGKKEEVLLEHIPRMRLARSLKAMDMVPNIPKLRFMRKFEIKPIKKFFLEYNFVSLLKDAGSLI